LLERGMIVGIDPGASGAIAWLSDDGHLVTVEDLPVAKVKVGKTMRSRMLPAALAAMLVQRRPAAVFLEEVQPMGTNGSIANFSLGKSAGLIEGIVAGLGIPLTMVRPKDWQKHYGLSGGDKGSSRARAMQIWPGSVDSFARVKDDGRAEAALIGLWGTHRMQGAPSYGNHLALAEALA
jgi:crossover junction endodeoxyribonuclease RuvC